MFAGTITKTATKTNISYAGSIHSRSFDIAIKLVVAAKLSPKSPDFAITAVNTAGRTVKIGSAWNETSPAGNAYISMAIDVGHGQFRVNAVQSKEAAKGKSAAFEIIPFIANTSMPSGSMSGELIAMDADDAFAGHVASLMFDLDFVAVPNAYKTEEKHPDYRLEIRSPNGTVIRVGSAWKAVSERTGNSYMSLLINTPDGDLRVNAVQNDDQRRGNAYAIIPFIDVDADTRQTGTPLGLVA